MSTYAIDDEHCNTITTGLSEHDAHRVAQAIANDRGKTVYLYATDSNEEPEEIEPE